MTGRLFFTRAGMLAVAGLLAGCGARSALELAEGSQETPETPRIVDLSGSASATCALRSDGAVACWGAPFAEPAPAPFADGVEISIGREQACARAADGQVVCLALAFGGEGPAEPQVVPGIADATQISAGAAHACALRAGGALSCWGDNTFGQLGDGTFAAAETPVPVGLGPVLAVSAGEFATCALTEVGVYCWGRALDGQLGDGAQPHEACAAVEETCSPSPVLVQGLSGPRRVSAGLNGACALDGDSRVRCWGWHSGVDLHGTSPIAVEVPGALDATDVFAGYTRACVIRPGGGVRCWGDNGTGALGDGEFGPREAPVDVVGLGGVVRVTGGWYHTCALREDGDVLCWGGNGFDQLGDDTSGDRASPGPVPLP